MITLWLYIVFGNQLVSEAKQEQIKFYISDSYVHVESKSLKDSIEIKYYSVDATSKKKERIFSDGNKYCRIIENKGGITVFLGDKTGAILLSNGRRN